MKPTNICLQMFYKVKSFLVVFYTMVHHTELTGDLNH